MADTDKEQKNVATQSRSAGPDGQGARPQSDGNGAQPGNGAGQAEETKAPDPAKRRIFTLVGIVVLVVAVLWGIKYWQYSQSHASTDDAYITGNLVNVSPIISGTLNQLTVDEGNFVHRGEVIGRLEDSGERASVNQAKQSYLAAQSQIPQAETAVAYQQASTNAAIQRAQAGLQSQLAKTSGARAQVALTQESVTNQVAQAEQQEAAASAQAAEADAQVETARAAVETAKQNVESSQQAANAALANVDSAQASYVRANSDSKRYQALLVRQAVTPQQNDQAQATVQTAAAQLSASKDQAAQAASQVHAQQAAVAQAVGQMVAAEKAANAAHRQVQVALAGVNVARAGLGQITVQQNNLTSNQGSNSQALADLAAAQAGRQQVIEKQQDIDTLKAQALQAKAALDNANVQLADTVIYAPSDGMVVKKAVNIGAALSPGQTIVTMTAGSDVWVTANFKETQLAGVKPGQSAEVDVDAYPNVTFRGRVESINLATGASIALLPPDNATGNFTKVVQRIPVRIELIPSTEGGKWGTADDIKHLGQGMSVTATIDTGSKS